jgi:hypothetical protein
LDWWSDLPTSTKIIYLSRGAVAAGSIAAGSIWLVEAAGRDQPLTAALFFFGGFVLVHVLLDLIFREAQGTPATANPTDGLRGILTAFIATPATVLALLQVFNGQNTFTATIQVGAVALVFALVVASMLYMFVILPFSSTRDHLAMNLMSSLIMLSLWGTAFGLACVGFEIAFRN